MTGVRVLARGAENTTYLVDGIVIRHSADLRAQQREVTMLRALAPTVSVPIPRPLFHDRRGRFGYRHLSGIPLIEAPRFDPTSVGEGIVEVLRAFHNLAPQWTLPIDDYAPQQWHDDAQADFARIRTRLHPDRRRLIERTLDAGPPAAVEGLLAQHNDLGAEHLLVDGDGRLCGILDWTDAARAEPVRDLGSLYRDLGPDVAARVASGLGVDLDDAMLDGVRFHARCRWLEDAAFAAGEPATRRAYLTNADRTFDHTFATAA